MCLAMNFFVSRVHEPISEYITARRLLRSKAAMKVMPDKACLKLDELSFWIHQGLTQFFEDILATTFSDFWEYFDLLNKKKDSFTGFQ